MTESLQLLAEYSKSASEEAFRELVSRYLGLVYSTALRLVGGDAHLAEDVAQTVFVDFARKAHALPGDVMLGGWLHRHTCFVAAKTMRGERRRQSRERQFVEMSALEDSPDSTRVAPVLDEAINQLGDADRSAILLRFFEQRDFRSVGEALGVNEDAARMRVNRALDKLHASLRKRGVTSTVAALGMVLTAEATGAAPVGMAAAISSAALSGASVTGSGTFLTTLKIMATTKLKLALGALALIGAATALLVQHQSQLKLREENEALRRQVASLQASNAGFSQREENFKSRLAVLSSPDKANGAASPDANSKQGNLWERYNKDGAPKLTAAQLEGYLRENGRKSASLLAAYRTSGDGTLLKEAMQKFPNDPQVAFEAATSPGLTAAERGQWAKTLEETEPDNALGNYLSAFYEFTNGQTNEALQDLTGASGKDVQNYTLSRIENDDEAYLAAGYSPAEAEVAATMSLALGQLAPVKAVGQSLVAMAQSYNQSGDPASAQAALQEAMQIGQSLQSSSPDLITPLVGMAIQKIALNAMDPASPEGDSGQTAQEQIDQLTQTRQAMNDLVQQAEPLMAGLTDQELANYTNRRLMFGEMAAMQWLVGKYGQQ